MVKTTIPLAAATRIADAVVADLEPHYECVAVAGSLRRQKVEVRDLDMVAIPKTVLSGLWGTPPIDNRQGGRVATECPRFPQ
jgi:DNA polymerase/3'-5' exonuclease PolX